MAKVSGTPTLLVNSIYIYLYLSEIKEIQGSITRQEFDFQLDWAREKVEKDNRLDFLKNALAQVA